MGSNPQIVHETLERLIESAATWPDVRVSSQDDGVTQLLLGRGVLARLHADGLIEIPFPRPVGEKLVAAGRAERHHALPDSGWVGTRIATAEDEARVLELLRLAYEPRRPGAEPGAGASKASKQAERGIDESVEGTFPASDPPAPNRE